MRSFLITLVLFGSCLSAFASFEPENYFVSSRYDYFTDEEMGQVLVYAPESKAGTPITVDVVFAFNFLNRGVPVFPGHAMPVSFSLKGFKPGDNEVTISFYENEKWVDSRKVNVVVRPKKFNEVKCDLLTGTLVADGLPFFPMGFYCQWPVLETFPEEEAVKGFNLMSPYWNIDKKNRKSRLEFMDRCAQLGMKVNYNVCNVTSGGVHAEKLNKEEKLALLQKEVEALRDHPALLAWYLYDEPEGQGVPPDSLQAAYDLIKKLDPYHPVTIVFMAPHMADRYANVMDIAMTDPYPVPSGPITQVEEYIETLNGYFRYRKPVWLVPQAFGGNEWWTREPDPREVRAMTYLGLIHHASGVQYFIRKGLNGSPKSQAVWGECGAMAQELMELLPSLAYGQPAPPAVSSNKEVQARTINRNGVFTILVVNTSNEPKEFSLQLEGIDLVMEVEVLFEGRKVFMQNGMFTDMIDAYGTRLYRVDGEMRPDWRKDFKAGNLVVDPGFEDIANAGIPAACYVDPGKDRGATFFLDARVHKQGLHSIRLITPRAEAGAKLRFFGLELDPDKSYTCSVWAKKAASDPNLKPEDMDFTMSLGVDQTAQFLLNDTWTEYSFTTAGVPVKPSLHRWSMPGLELNSAGTAWFDMLQVVPDLEIMHRAKGIGQDGIEKQGQGSMEVELRSSQADALIYYTIDGTEPSLSSKMYQEPFLLTESATVRAAAFKEGTLVGSIQKAFTVHKATGASVKYEILYEQYEGGGHTGLVDGILASANYKDGRWQGFHGQDAIFSIDLGDIQQISEVSMHFLQDITVWIFLPREVRVSVSTDGITFTPLATISHEVPLEKRGAMIHEFQAQFSPVQARYIRVEAGSIQLCPSWHSGAGQPAWIFLDEVILN